MKTKYPTVFPNLGWLRELPELHLVLNYNKYIGIDFSYIFIFIYHIYVFILFFMYISLCITILSTYDFTVDVSLTLNILKSFLEANGVCLKNI